MTGAANALAANAVRGVVPTPDPLMVIEEVAAMTRKSVPTLRRWRATGEGPPSALLGRTLVWRASDVTAWIEEQFAKDAAGGKPAA